VQRLWSLGGWSYLHPNRGHSSILTQLQQSDPIFNRGVDVMRPAFNFEPKYRITIPHTYPSMKMEQSVPKRRHINFRRRGITQKKAYNIQNTAKV
jgi:hypothetical protein